MKALQYTVLYASKAGIILDSCAKIETAINMRDSLPVEAFAKVIVHCSKHGIQVCEDAGCVECEGDQIDTAYERYVEEGSRAWGTGDYNHASY